MNPTIQARPAVISTLLSSFLCPRMKLSAICTDIIGANIEPIKYRNSVIFSIGNSIAATVPITVSIIPGKFNITFFLSVCFSFVSGENLWTLTKLAKMFDPEGIDGINTASGLGYPIMKTVSAGVSVTL